MQKTLVGGHLSRRVADLHASPIREILSLIDRPGMVSFAGGLPAAETFPTLSLAAFPPTMMQYGSSEGEPELRERVADDLNAIGLKCSPGQEWPTAQRPSFVYTIPTFQNPTGRCYSNDERNALARACDEQGVPLFEDDPYRDLAYDGGDRTPICAWMKRASWIYQGSFSKSLAPGLRLGFLAASVDLMAYLIPLKQAADLHSNRISQWLVLEQLRDPHRMDRLAHVVATYRHKRDFFANALERYLGKFATWQMPPGGLFFWLTLSRRIDTRTLLPEAIQRGVAFMPGEPFYSDLRESCGALRLNFSHADEEQAERGLAILASILS